MLFSEFGEFASFIIFTTLSQKPISVTVRPNNSPQILCADFLNKNLIFLIIMSRPKNLN